MEIFEPVAMPKFKSPEEEIAFLREQVSQKESQLVSAGM